MAVMQHLDISYLAPVTRTESPLHKVVVDEHLDIYYLPAVPRTKSPSHNVVVDESSGRVSIRKYQYYLYHGIEGVSVWKCFAHVCRLQFNVPIRPDRRGVLCFQLAGVCAAYYFDVS